MLWFTGQGWIDGELHLKFIRFLHDFSDESVWSDVMRLSSFEMSAIVPFRWLVRPGQGNFKFHCPQRQPPPPPHFAGRLGGLSGFVGWVGAGGPRLCSLLFVSEKADLLFHWIEFLKIYILWNTYGSPVRIASQDVEICAVKTLSSHWINT